MELDLDHLPEDPTALRAIVARLAEEKARLVGENHALRVETGELKGENERLKAMVTQLVHYRFGRSSESAEGQHELYGQTVEPEAARPPAPTERASSAAVRLKQQRPIRKPLPAHLPRLTKVLDVGDACGACGKGLVEVGEPDVTEVLHRIPATYVVLRYVRPRKRCAEGHFDQEPMPERVIPRSTVDETVLAGVIVDKFADHLPLNRIAKRFARQKIDIPRQTLADWMMRSAAVLGPLHEALARHVMAGEVVHPTTRHCRSWSRGSAAHGPAAPGAMSATSGLGPGRRRQQRSSSRPSIARVSDHANTCGTSPGHWRWTPTAGSTRCSRPGAARRQRSRRPAVCAHARRKFVELERLGSPVGKEGVRLWQAVFLAERRLRTLDADERLGRRQSSTRPAFEELHAWMTSIRPLVADTSAPAKALDYSLKRWPSLTLALADGRVEVDNNAAERALRGIALFRNNALFAGSPRGAEATAVLVSLVETCKLNAVDPEAYLADVLPKLKRQPRDRLADLLPWSWLTTAGASPRPERMAMLARALGMAAEESGS